MTATFSPELNDVVSRVRFALGDTDVDNPEVQDETINYFIQTQMLSASWAAARIAAHIMAKYARLADVNVDDQLTRYSHVYEHWKDLTARLEAIAKAEDAAPSETTAGTSSYGPIMVGGIGDCRGPLSDYPPNLPLPGWLF